MKLSTHILTIAALVALLGAVATWAFYPHASKAPSLSGAATTTSIVIAKENAGQTIRLTQGQEFVVNFGTDMNWYLAFNPTGIVTQTGPADTKAGTQGVFVAAHTGTTTLSVNGGPICKPNEACPQFRVQVPDISITVQ